ncbi:MAG: peptidylprolyl isomerase [Thiofilum sp.]
MSTNPKVLLETSKGNITIELDAKSAPISTENFLGYVRDGFYDGLVFHRVIPNFMIQGGGMNEAMQEKSTKAPIRNEANNGLKNMRGTLAMARTNVPHSASSQFFINTKDNDFLNFRSETPQGWGYAVFGKVTAGMDVVDAIEKVRTGSKGRHDDVPVEAVTIVKATEIKE